MGRLNNKGYVENLCLTTGRMCACVRSTEAVTQAFSTNRSSIIDCCWLHGTVVERLSVAGELSLSYARPAADG